MNSPRDAVMISRTFSDTNTVIDVSTSLPRSPDEPSYLRPSPPYVRSHVDRKHSESLSWWPELTHLQSSHGAYNSHPPYRNRLPTTLDRSEVSTPGDFA